MPGSLAERLQDVAVVGLEVVAVRAESALAQSSPAGTSDGSVVRRLRLLVGHLEEEQVRELLDVVAVGEAVVAEDVAVVPELLDDLLGMICRHVGIVDERLMLVADLNRTSACPGPLRNEFQSYGTDVPPGQGAITEIQR